MDNLPLVFSSLALIVSIAALIHGFLAKKEIFDARTYEKNELHNRINSIKHELWKELHRAIQAPSIKRPSSTSGNVSQQANQSQHDEWEMRAYEIARELENRVRALEIQRRSFEREQETSHAQRDSTSNVPDIAISQEFSEHMGRASGEEDNVVQRPLRPEEEQVVQLYNLAVRSGDRGAFMRRYQIERIGVANAGDLARNPNLEPLFEASDSGDYLGITLDGIVSGDVIVVPKLGMTYGEELHQRAGMRHVFQSYNYDPELRYLSVQLITPAVFKSTGGASFMLDEPGILNLGQGE